RIIHLALLTCRELYTPSLHDALPIWALRTSDQVAAISSYTAREIAELVRVPVRVIPYGLGFTESQPGTRDKGLGNRDSFQILYRSEEHTSELQSPDHLVCRVLLEKKK